jgi:hypothetical protein
MSKMPLYRAKEHLQRDVGHGSRVTIVDWHRVCANEQDVLFVIGSYIQHYPDPDLKPEKMFRMGVFVNGKPRIGDYIDAP